MVAGLSDEKELLISEAIHESIKLHRATSIHTEDEPRRVDAPEDDKAVLSTSKVEHAPFASGLPQLITLGPLTETEPTSPVAAPTRGGGFRTPRVSGVVGGRVAVHHFTESEDLSDHEFLIDGPELADKDAAIAALTERLAAAEYSLSMMDLDDDALMRQDMDYAPVKRRSSGMSESTREQLEASACVGCVIPIPTFASLFR